MSSIPTMKPFKAAFRKWLFARRERTVGTTNLRAWCPIATFLSSEYGWKHVRVSHAIVSTAGLSLALPKWARQFITEIDSPQRPGACDYQDMTGAECLEVLNEPHSLTV